MFHFNPLITYAFLKGHALCQTRKTKPNDRGMDLVIGYEPMSLTLLTRQIGKYMSPTSSIKKKKKRRIHVPKVIFQLAK